MKILNQIQYHNHYLRIYIFICNNDLQWDVTTIQWFCNGHDKYERNYIGVPHADIFSGWINVWN